MKDYICTDNTVGCVPVGNGLDTPSQYGVPDGAVTLNDLIEHRNMSFAQGNVFKAMYRKGTKNEWMYELNKAKYYVERMIAEEERNA